MRLFLNGACSLRKDNASVVTEVENENDIIASSVQAYLVTFSVNGDTEQRSFISRWD